MPRQIARSKLGTDRCKAMCPTNIIQGFNMTQMLTPLLEIRRQNILKSHFFIYNFPQVSIISLSNRNHYLNITPNNVVAVYHCQGEGLQRMRFHSSQESLQSVLSALEKKALADSSSMNSSVTGTPVSLTG